MLNHLDDPAPHTFPDDFRERVQATGRSRRRRRRLARRGAATLCLLALGTVGVYGAALSRAQGVDRLTVAGTGDPAGSHRTVLVAGVDGGPDGRRRTDTLLVVRLDGGRASVLSIPRDLAVPSPDGEGDLRVNTVADGYGYAGLLRVLVDRFGIDVDNVVEVDFDGFARLVDLVGGVDVEIPAPIRDRSSGLALDVAGCQRLDGQQALALARARHPERYVDGRWITDPTGDLGRIDRQPALVTAGLQALSRSRPDPLTADRLSRWLVEHAAVDETLDGGELLDLIRTVRALDPGELSFTDLPVEAATLEGGAMVVRAAAGAEDVVDGWLAGVLSPDGNDAVVRPCVR